MRYSCSLQTFLLGTQLWLQGMAAPIEPPEEDYFWHQWRGPHADGVAPAGDPPIEWSETKNIAWKVEIPGKGSATPIIWRDQIFVLTAVPTGQEISSATGTSGSETADGARQGRPRGPEGIQPTRVQQFTILALERSSGQTRWKKVLREELPHEGTHPTGTWASGSPVTDGERVYAYFGSRGLYCLDLAGNLLWEKDLGDMEIRLGFGEGASPALQGDRIVVNWDHQGQSFIVALDKRTGEELWRTNREEITSWTTPLIVEHGGRSQVVTGATNRIRSYDLETGELIWEGDGLTLNPIPSPVAADGFVYLTSGFRGNKLVAVRLDEARGDITDTPAIAWALDRNTPYTPSPLLYDDRLYFLKSNNGILFSYGALNGEQIFGPVRLPDVPNIYASPVGVADRIYIAGREGNTVVVEHADEFNILSVNTLDDGFDASPAIVGDEIYLRGKSYLYRISE